MSQGAERRRATRVDAQIQLQVHLPTQDGPTELETVNVSSAGMYFISPHFVEPMTKLQLQFELPISAEELVAIECEGIVVRVSPEMPSDADDGYEVAVFFTTIDAGSHANLERYIEARLRATQQD